MVVRAQGTVEYLVVIAVVIVLSLIVVGLVVTQVDNSSNVTTTSSEISTKIGVSGLSLASSVMGADENGLLVLKNISVENLILNKIIVDGVDHNFFVSLFANDELSFKLQNVAQCVGEKKSYSVKVEYVSASGLTKVADFGIITIDCTSIVTPVGVVVEESIISNLVNIVPSISFSSPVSPFSTAVTRVSFVFTPIDSDGTIASCSLNLSNLMDANSSSNISMGVENTLEYTLGVGTYDWNISCTDNSGDTNTSQTSTIIIQSSVVDCTGGVITTYNDYTVHTFLTNGTFECAENVDVEVMVVAGGGGGGAGYGGGGGGGAGGVLHQLDRTIVSGTYQVVIGQGGIGYEDSIGTNGGNTTFNGLTAIGGGGGGYGGLGRDGIGVNGGSGGGNGGYGTGGGSTAIQGDVDGAVGYGYAGGGAFEGTGGGGGGASSIGLDGSGYSTGATGGSGYTFYGNKYAGGGGGGYSGVGTDGGGNGGASGGYAGENASTYGSGGGGGGDNHTAGGTGGSGIVIIKYLTNQ